MIDRRTKNAEIFCDTERRYTSDSTLMSIIQQSIQAQVFIAETDNIIIPSAYKSEKAKIVISGKRSLEAAESYAKQGKKVCVLNFASATNPSGGSSVQEESICRCTTLYPCLNTDKMWNAFYKPHRKAANPLYNNDCVYTPDVCVFKSDTNFPEPLFKEDWWDVNILPCAAPNLRERPSNSMNPHAGDKSAKITPAELEKLLTKRIRRIFEITEDVVLTYEQISAKDAKKLMDTESDYIIVDARTTEEFAEGYIPNAILIPEYEIADRAPAELPDKDRLILVYCRSGRRSKITSAALVELGYTNVKEFGRINDWPYDVVTD